ncbi:MAG: carbohydrate ABC transporter permease [Pseudomonadota bacterium]
MAAVQRQPAMLRALSSGFLTFWCIIAFFPIFWITVMSVKNPLDALAKSPVQVFFGPRTLAQGDGLSIIDIVLGLITIGLLIYIGRVRLAGWVKQYGLPNAPRISWVLAVILFCIATITVLFGILPLLSSILNSIGGPLGTNIVGLTTEHYEAVWFERGFTRNFTNSLIVTAGVVTVSLTIGTLAGYALARSGGEIAFWLLVAALIFRALPHSVLVAGYLPVFIKSADILRPILGEAAPTLYGQPWAVIIVLVAINQPFTIWLLRSFFQNIPEELDEAAKVDGCTHFQAFRLVIIPVMWPGVITAGLFSFLLAYNDFLVTSLLLDGQNMTMVPAIANMFNRETNASDEVQAIAAAVSITAPLFLLVVLFQRQLVSGLTAGAVKG